MASTISAWMIFRGDVIDGKTVKWNPSYTGPAKTHVRVTFTDGTDVVLAKDADVIVDSASPKGL